MPVWLSKETAQETFKALLNDHFVPPLKERGFRRRDTTFRRRQDQAWQIINLQRSKYSDSRAVQFTINVGVGMDTLHDDPRWSSRGWPLEYECDFHERVGFLLPQKQDLWWEVRPGRRNGKVVDEVRAALGSSIRWLDLYANPELLLHHALEDPAQVGRRNLHALMLLAKQVGSESDLKAVEGELDRWQRDVQSAK